MAERPDLASIGRKLEELVRPRALPIGFKLVEDEGVLGKIKFRRPDWKGTVCQYLAVARTYGWTLGFGWEDLAMAYCGAIIGLCEMPEEIEQGLMTYDVWFKTVEDAKKHVSRFPRIPAGKYRAAVVGPLRTARFEPDIVIVYATPAQMTRVVAGIQWEDYERLEFGCTGESSCSDLLAQPLLSGKPCLALPCWGERRFAGTPEDELAISFPLSWADRIIGGMEETHRRGIRYPVPLYGPTLGPERGVPEKYKGIQRRYVEKKTGSR